jgi:hypothetical protein
MSGTGVLPLPEPEPVTRAGERECVVCQHLIPRGCPWTFVNGDPAHMECASRRPASVVVIEDPS